MISRPRRGLAGRVVLLLSSAPGAGEKDPVPDAESGEVWFAEDVDEAADEAVIGLARAVFAEGGRVAVLGDAEVALLVATVAGEYARARSAEGPHGEAEERRDPPPVLFFADARPAPDAGGSTEPLAVLARLGYAELHAGFADGSPRGIVGKVRPVAVVCIGGGAEERAAAEALAGGHDGEPPVYLIETTGGAAEALASSAAGSMIPFARDVLERIPKRAAEEQPDAVDEPRRSWTPYPLILQLLVARLAGRTDAR